MRRNLLRMEGTIQIESPDYMQIRRWFSAAKRRASFSLFRKSRFHILVPPKSNRCDGKI